MNNDLTQIGAPPSMDVPGGPAPEPQGNPEDAHYRGPDSRCYNCEYFRDPATCTKGVNGGTIEPEGGCDLFEAADEDGDEGEMSGSPEDLQT